MHVYRLRKTLGDAAVLETTPAGYRLQVRPGELDADRFERLFESGRRELTGGNPELATNMFADALALWRGPPLADLEFETFAQAEIARLHHQRELVLEARMEAELAAGRHFAILADLQRAVDAAPTREPLTGRLMLALYRCGLQTDALEAFTRLRTALLEEVGVEPGPDLRRLQESILRQDEALLAPDRREASPAIAGDAPRASAVMPLTLVRAELRRFVGRARQLEGLRAGWRQSSTGETGFSVVAGEAGIGKTRLLSHFAHEMQRSEGALVLYGRCDEEVLIPYQPFVEALRFASANGVIGTGDASAAEFDTLSRLVPELADGESQSTPEVGAHVDVRRYQLFELVAGLFLDLTRRVPLLLIVDDLHWADRATLLMLRHLLRRLDGEDSMVLAAYRPTDVAPDAPLHQLLRGSTS